MPDHTCNKEREITEIHSMLMRIDEGLRGNGKPGLFTEFAISKQKLDHMDARLLKTESVLNKGIFLACLIAGGGASSIKIIEILMS